MKKLKIGFIGNFTAPYTTENDRKWSFEQLGHEVIPFQENETNDIEILSACEKLDVLFYSHTHGWNIPDLKIVFYYCKSKNIPTVSVHLDRWAWLDREKDVGKEATWFTEWQFMADGSPEAVELYEKHNLNWRFLAPGVVERDCYMAKPNREKYPHDIVFVGSKGYHEEYPFRTELIDRLENTYGTFFAQYGGGGLGTIRGHELNVLYSSAKVVVGDTCFGGRPYYWSDRVTETMGRGGFLLHPWCDGMGDMLVNEYCKNSLRCLETEISYFLNNDSHREAERKRCHYWVKEHATYTNRAKEMLQTIFGK